MVTERLGVSRTPLREAFRQLADDGLVAIRPQSFLRGRFFDFAELDIVVHKVGRLSETSPE